MNGRYGGYAPIYPHYPQKLEKMDAVFSDSCEKIVDKSAKNPFKTLHFIKKKRIIKETPNKSSRGHVEGFFRQARKDAVKA